MIEKRLETETRNSATYNLDRCSTLEILELINTEDQKVALVIKAILEKVSEAIDAADLKMQQGGRLIYFGAGTSGRLGVLDASECPPTFGVSPDLVVGLMAGGESAIIKAKEGAEDSFELAVEDLKKLELNENDVVVGLAASGRTPYVIGGLEYANSIGALTLAISCVNNAKISAYAKYPLEAVVGAEALTGSTRMKAGTAQKLLLNMLSTTLMIKKGKVYQNLMIDVQPTNEKLVARAHKIISQAANISLEEAISFFDNAKGNVKVAILMAITNLDAEACLALLANTNDNVTKIIHEYQ